MDENSHFQKPQYCAIYNSNFEKKSSFVKNAIWLGRNHEVQYVARKLLLLLYPYIDFKFHHYTKSISTGDLSFCAAGHLDLKH